MSLIYDLETILQSNDAGILDDKQAIGALHKVVENYDIAEQADLEQMAKEFNADKTH